MQGFAHFLLRKTTGTCGQKTGSVACNRPLEVEDVKRAGWRGRGWKFSREFRFNSPNTPVSSLPIGV